MTSFLGRQIDSSNIISSSPPAGGSGSYDVGMMNASMKETLAMQIVQADKGGMVGPVVAGLIFSCVMFGAVINQVLRWLLDSRKDSKHVRVLMGWAIIGLLATEIYIWAWCMRVFVDNYGSYSQLLSRRYNSWFGIMAITVVLPLRIFFAERAYRLSGRSKVLLGCIGIAIMGGITAEIGLTVIHSQLGLLETSPLAEPFFWVCPVSCVSADLLITVSIAYNLWRQRTGWSRTDNLIRRIIRMTAEAQIPGLILALGFFISTRIKGNSRIALFFLMIFAKPYMIGTMAVLNQRHTDERARNGTVYMTGLNKFTDNSGNSTAQSQPQTDTLVSTLSQSKSFDPSPREQSQHHIPKIRLNRVESVHSEISDHGKADWERDEGQGTADRSVGMLDFLQDDDSRANLHGNARV